MDKISKAIENLYSAFSDLPKPEVVGGCSCCITEQELDTLMTIPLGKLSPDQIGTYASNALLTVGDVEDYLYFLPRIIDISIHEEDWWPDIEVTAQAIRSAGFHEWPTHHRNALNDVFLAAIEHFVDEDDYSRLDSWMCAIGRIEIDVAPFLNIIEKSESAVFGYWEENADTLDNHRLSNAFAQPGTSQHDAIVQWFHSARINLIYAEAYGKLTAK